MNRIYFQTLCAALLLTGLSARAQHHWLRPSTYQPKTEKTVTLKVMAGPGLDTASVKEAVPAQVEELKLYYGMDSAVIATNTGQKAFQVPKEKFKNLTLARAKIRLPEAPLTAAEMTANLTKEQKEFLDQNAKEVPQTGLKAERLHFAKTLVKATDYQGKIHELTVQDPLEIALKYNPFLLKPNQEMLFQLTRDRRLMVNYPFTVFFRDKRGKVTSWQGRCTDLGLGRFKMKEPGTYMIYVEQSGPSAIEAEGPVKWQVLEATFTFEIPEIKL